MSSVILNGLVRHGVHAKIDAVAVDAAIRFVERTGIADEIATWRTEDRRAAGRHNGGRPPRLDDRTVLVVLLLLAVENKPLLLTHASEVLKNRLSQKSLKLLGIDYDIPGVDWYSSFWRAWRRFHDTVDPYPAPRRRYLTDTEADTIREARDPEVCAERARRLSRVANCLIEGTWKMLPRDIRRRWKGNIAIDATVVRSGSKPRTVRRNYTVEIDAGWYRRDGDHRDPGDERGRVISKLIWGWETHLAIATANEPTERPDFPLIVTAMTFDTPSAKPAENAMELLWSMEERKMPKGVVTTDRLYWPMSKADKLQSKARAMGWRNCNDYDEDHLGATIRVHGAVQVEGAWYSPSMPTELITATIDYRLNKIIDEETWIARIAAREPYLLLVKGRPDKHGNQRFMCPATGPSPTLVCPLRELSFEATRAPKNPHVTPPKHLDLVCTQGSITIPFEEGLKFQQDIRFGTPLWRAHYATARNTIEGFNGFVKDTAREGLGCTTRRRVRGRTAQNLMVALLVVAANIRKVRVWLIARDEQAAKVAEAARAAKTSSVGKHRKGRSKAQAPSEDLHVPEPNAPPGLTGTEN